MVPAILVNMKYAFLQATEQDHQDSPNSSNEIEDTDISTDILDTDGADEIRSTKRPTGNLVSNKPTKRQKREAQEDILLQKAIACMERTGQQMRDEDDQKTWLQKCEQFKI